MVFCDMGVLLRYSRILFGLYVSELLLGWMGWFVLYCIDCVCLVLCEYHSMVMIDGCGSISRRRIRELLLLP